MFLSVPLFSPLRGRPWVAMKFLALLGLRCPSEKLEMRTCLTFEDKRPLGQLAVEFTHSPFLIRCCLSLG